MTVAKPITIADVERLNDGRRYDLIRGELVSMAPAHFRHGHIALRIGAKLLVFVMAHGLGQVCGAETGFILARNPDVLLAPDAAFVRAERQQRFSGSMATQPNAGRTTTSAFA